MAAETETEARARIDNKITRYTSLICKFRSEWNNLSPICRLPPELLATIFIACASDHHNGTNDSYFTRDVPAWVNVSYVCRYWRGVALDRTTLWTYHFVTSPRWTEELLIRSKKKLLKVSGNIMIQNDSRKLNAVKKMMAQAERIQELHLDLPEDGIAQVLRFSSSRAPCLQTLDLKLWGTDSSKQYPVVVLFRGDTPALHTLELKACPMPWYLLNLSGLTTLSLCHVPVCFQQETAEFLATLRHMQDLKYLYLDDALARVDSFLYSPAFHSRLKIDLPRLSRLLIAAPLSTVATLLSCINIPGSFKTELRLTCYCGGGSYSDNCTLLSSVLAQWFSMPSEVRSSPAIRSLIIDFTWWRSVAITFSGSERASDSCSVLSGPSWDCNSPLGIVLVWSRRETTKYYHVGDICSSITLPHVQSVHVIDPPFPPFFWKQILGRFQGLRSLKLSRGDMPDLASVLALAVNEGANCHGHTTRVDADRILTPGLEELELNGISFSQYDELEEDSAITQPRLFHALSTRLNARQGRLTMTQCKIRVSEQLDVVRSWDGVVISEGDLDSSKDDSDDD